MLQFLELQTVRHDLVTQQQQQNYSNQNSMVLAKNKTTTVISPEKNSENLW